MTFLKRAIFRITLRVVGAAVATSVCLCVGAAGPNSLAGEQEAERRSELIRMGKRGEEVARARERALEILESNDGCAHWFQEVNADAAEILASVHYAIEEHGPVYVYSVKSGRGDSVNKHPWGASTRQGGGPNSWILLNANGPFFTEAAPVLYVDAAGSFAAVGGRQLLLIGSFAGSTREAQIAILLHELGHILGRLPDDDDSWDRRSSQNTIEVLLHCKQAIRRAARNNTASK